MCDLQPLHCRFDLLGRLGPTNGDHAPVDGLPGLVLPAIEERIPLLHQASLARGWVFLHVVRQVFPA